MMSKLAVTPEHSAWQTMLLISVLDGLPFSCVSPNYLNAIWLKQRFGFSDNGMKFYNSPYDYIQHWYLPVLRCGGTLPFFLVLDLGLSFLERAGTEYRNQDHNYEYREFLRGLINTHESSIRKLIFNIQEDMLRIQHYELRERVPPPQRRTRLIFSRLCFKTVPIFIENLLPHLERTLHLEGKYNLDGLRYGNFNWPLKGWDVDWSKAAKGQGASLSKEAQKLYEQMGMKDFNKHFFAALSSTSSEQASPEFSSIKTLSVRTSCLDWVDKPQTDPNDEEHNAEREPAPSAHVHGSFEMSNEMDLMLLSNYCRHHKLLLGEDQQKTQSFNKRILISNLTRSRQPGGGLQEIGTQGRISALLKSQLSLLYAHPNLFYYKLYNHKLLYYMNMVSQYRPMKILTAVIIDTGPSTHVYLPGSGYKNALAREVAAYLIEDTCRSISQLEGVALDLSIHLRWPNDLPYRPFFLHFSEDHAHLLETELPFVTHLPEILPCMFKLNTATSPMPQSTEAQQDNFADVEGRLQRLREAWDSIYERAQQETRIAVSETGRRSSSIPYDCSHVAVITGDIKNASALQNAFESHYLSRLARHSLLHQFVLGDQHVEWTAGTLESPVKETYSNMRDGSNPHPENSVSATELPGRIRRGFVGHIINEAIRDRISFLA